MNAFCVRSHPHSSIASLFTSFPPNHRGLLGSYRNVPETSDPTAFISPTTLVSLLERHCAVALACTKKLHAVVLPASYAASGRSGAF